MTTTATTAGIGELYETLNPRSRALFERQSAVIGGGSSHTARRMDPFPLFIAENRGARKRDVDGHEYVDYWLGHGAMLLGHSHPAVVQAIAKQAGHGTHGGGETELGCRWAELIQEMVPSASRVRFLAAGGEATQMAIRLARAHTGKVKIIKFEGGFHGWHDAVSVAMHPPYHVPDSPGVPRQIFQQTLALPFNDLEAVEAALSRNDDIAALIMEPGGLHGDTVLSDPQFLRGVRELTADRHVVLIFDEVVTGFRYALGGVQERYGVTPDLTTLGKVIGGGLPVGAVVGCAEIMELFDAGPMRVSRGLPVVTHPGTWNALPVVAAAGIATLEVVRETDAVDRAHSLTERLVEGFNSVYRELNVKAFAYTRSSICKTCPGEPPPMVRGDFSSAIADAEQLTVGWGPKGPVLRKAMLLEGVDSMRAGGFLSTAHTEADVDATCEALGRALSRLRKESFL